MSAHFGTLAAKTAGAVLAEGAAQSDTCVAAAAICKDKGWACQLPNRLQGPQGTSISRDLILLNLIFWLVVGGLLGWVASLIIRTEGQQGWFLNVVVGIVGATLAGWSLRHSSAGPPSIKARSIRARCSFRWSVASCCWPSST
jgi:uncharacterized membrane protein YeaQ/YmgE (transglycosylase-associated protein family)